MKNILTSFKAASPLVLILVSVTLGIVAKVIELKFSTIAMGLQLITFMLFVYAIIKFFNSIFK